MKSTVLQFELSRARRQHAEGEIDILKTIAELRSHLESLERAINAVENLALSQIGEDSMHLPKTPSPKKTPTPSGGKGRVVAFRRLRQTRLGKDTSNAVPE